MSDTPQRIWKRTRKLAGGAIEAAVETAKEGLEIAKGLGRRAAHGASEGAVAASDKVAQLFERKPAKANTAKSPVPARPKAARKAPSKKAAKAVTKKAATRTTHRSASGRKLYAVRDAEGQFKDIQTYERAHRADLAKKSNAEKAADKKKK